MQSSMPSRRMFWKSTAILVHTTSMPTKGLADLPEQVAQPEYATVVGLVLPGVKARRSGPHRSGTLVSKLKAMFAGAS